MRKAIKIIVLLLALAGVFMLGWRVMPRVWPTVKEKVVYPIFPDMKPTPAPTAEPYQPKATAQLGDPISTTDSLIYYFYRPTCAYCRSMAPLMGGLPKQITLPDGTTSNVKLIAVSKSDEQGGAIIADFYASHDVDENHRTVPAVVIGDRYLCPSAEIPENLLDALLAGEGLSTPLLDGGERTAD